MASVRLFCGGVKLVFLKHGVAGVGAGVWVSRRIQRQAGLAEPAHEPDGVAGGGLLGAPVAVHRAVGVCRLPADERDAGGGIAESRRVAMADVAQDHDPAGDGEPGGRDDPDVQLRDVGGERQPDSGDAREVLPGHQDDLFAGGPHRAERRQRGERVGRVGDDPVDGEPVGGEQDARQEVGAVVLGELIVGFWVVWTKTRQSQALAKVQNWLVSTDEWIL